MFITADTLSSLRPTENKIYALSIEVLRQLETWKLRCKSFEEKIEIQNSDNLLRLMTKKLKNEHMVIDVEIYTCIFFLILDSFSK